ncbi:MULTISPECIES: permease-like cell division protein FtsX [Pontibacillus]|uniref:Cell division protein FtsX n=1 Tax=Pontibacillus chungwhensis TaxID=265426 RepID=A0ABY8UYJ8_9BACI|nr:MULTISPECIES: permease-like cell division protein FtsX [Pontibacillus]MCD5325893.1 permease-like cell division protein FtsX [Pontibacillus sp. HN14]WIF97604.1 permease-like cell division protein FtsX [Pontibacillus chungwhensis]
MKLRTVGRHIREGGKNIYRNGWMTIASIGAVTTTLLLVGIFIALMLNLNQMATNVEDDVEIRVLVDLTAQDEDIETIESKIRDISEVSSVEFSSKEEELESLMQDMGEEGEQWELFEQDNPLNDAFVVKTENPIDTFDVADEIAEFDNIDEVTYGQQVVEKLLKFTKYSRYVGAGLIAGLVFTAIFLISNTIKLTITARSKEIGIMKLVGATNSFIRWPFFIEGMLLGILGALIPIGVTVGAYYYVYNNLREKINFSFVEIIPFDPLAWQLALILLAIGAFIGVWGSVMSVRKFLKV